MRLRYERGLMEKSGKTGQKTQRTAAEVRAERLKAALKANMAKRKAQSRERAAALELGPDDDQDNKNA
jgi:protein subunit release factor A